MKCAVTNDGDWRSSAKVVLIQSPSFSFRALRLVGDKWVLHEYSMTIKKFADNGAQDIAQK